MHLGLCLLILCLINTKCYSKDLNTQKKLILSVILLLEENLKGFTFHFLIYRKM